MSDEIKPCPCCGSTNVHAYNSKSAQYRQYSIKCMKCGLRVCKATLMEAKEVWNCRKEPERKKGEWLPHPWDDDWDVCSACGTGCKRREHNIGGCWTEYNYLFCPHCGADMRGEK